MSAFFGRYNFDEKPVMRADLEIVRPLLVPFGPDSESVYCHDNLGILHRGFQTTKESQRETESLKSSLGFVVAFDGRLDNRAEIIRSLGGTSIAHESDNFIAMAACDRWGTDGFAKLIGDWAISVWDPRGCALTLAKDFIGIRQLYYTIRKNEVLWSTRLDALTAVAGNSLSINEEYVAGWLSSYPAPDTTPYRGICSVPPSSFVRIRGGSQFVGTHWQFDSRKQIRYRTDAEYEEHFRSLFSGSVRRRLRSHVPVLAELSGGMDSSSIVCAGDALLRAGQADAPRLDTVSYFDDSEPNWNERPYVAAVEESRGRTGLHLAVTQNPSFNWEDSAVIFEASPGSCRTLTESGRQFSQFMELQGNRVLLSGIGGDEVTGGVPTPVPELADLWTRGHFLTLAHQLKSWALKQRRPWLHLLLESIHPFLAANLSREAERPCWIHRDLVRTQHRALSGYRNRLRIFGPLPSFQENLLTLNVLQRQLGLQFGPTRPLYEKRYPYLDRDLLEFLFAIPREQLVRPGQRRSLMRRALVGLVPDQVLNRRRKAFIVRSPMAAINIGASSLIDLSRSMESVALGFVDEDGFVRAVQRASSGLEFPFIPFMRTLSLELWLRGLKTKTNLA
jgi:asparagine synthase (glutamine-hydrolysing)